MFKDYLQKRFINWLIKDLYNTIDKDDILRVEKGVVYYKGKALDKDGIQILRENAETFKNSKIWRLLRNQVKYEANKKMFNESRVPADILFGKATLYALAIIEDKIKELSKL